MQREYEVVKRGVMYFLGLGIETDKEVGQEEIPLLWERFLREGVDLKIPKKKSEAIYVLYFDYDKSYKGSFRCMIGCEVKKLRKIPNEMMAKTVAASSYARFIDQGNRGQGWKKVDASKLPRTFAVDFEFYNHTFREKIPDTEIFVAVREKI